MKLSDYIVTFCRKKESAILRLSGTMIAHLVDSIERNPETENHSGYNEQGQLSQPADTHRRRKNVPAPMLPADREPSTF